MEIVFYDTETTVPLKKGERHELLEIAGVVVRAEGWVEVTSYETLILPGPLSAITRKSIEINGITKNHVSGAPGFADVADDVYRLLHGRVWAGHNIDVFDNLRIREAFERIGRPPPQPRGVIDTFHLLRDRFGKERTGNLKMATLSDYCGLGKQSHRALDDCRLNMAVLQRIAAILLLESHYPDLYASATPSQEPPQKAPPQEATSESTPPPRNRPRARQSTPPESAPPLAAPYLQALPDSPTLAEEFASLSMTAVQGVENVLLDEREVTEREGLGVLSDPPPPPVEDLSPPALCTSSLEVVSGRPDSSQRVAAAPPASGTPDADSWHDAPSESDSWQHQDPPPMPFQAPPVLAFHPGGGPDGGGGSRHPPPRTPPPPSLGASLDQMAAVTMSGRCQVAPPPPAGIPSWPSVLTAGDIDLANLHVNEEPSPWGGTRVVLLHNGVPLQVQERQASMRYTVNNTYAFDSSGRPTFSVVLEPSGAALQLLQACDELVEAKLRTAATWRPTVVEKPGERQAVRVRIGTVGFRGGATYTTQFFTRRVRPDLADVIEALPLSDVEAQAFRGCFPAGCNVDVAFQPEVYEFHGYAGVRLVATHLALVR